MIIGFIGLGKMGKNLVLNLLSKNIKVVGYDHFSDNTKELVRKGISPAFSIKDLVLQLPANKKIIWLMLPPDYIDNALKELRLYLTKGDTIIDAGNSFYKDSVRRYKDLKERGINFLDVGFSGGVEGALSGGSLAIGGDKHVYDELRLLFSSLSVKDGYSYIGLSGSGHYCKMIHDMIECAIMQSIGEGFELLKSSDFSFNLHEVARIWNHGSTIRSNLLELSEKSFENDKNLDNINSISVDINSVKFAILESIEKEVPVPVMKVMKGTVKDFIVMEYSKN